MREITISIGELYNKLVKNGEIDQFYNIADKSIYINDEHSKLIEVSSIIKKRDSMRTIFLKDKTISKTALNHLYFNGLETVNAKTLNVGDTIFTKTGHKEISEIEDKSEIEDVFDISVNSDTHLFQTANGIIHHNTSIFINIAKEKNMGYISVDVSNLKAEAFVGIPIAKTNVQTGEITTTFSEPVLYNSIMKEYNEIIETFRQDGRPYNIILLFDEISRTTPAVFNAMRKVLLEKEFSKGYELPKDVMVTGAMNPSGKGTTELTGHVRDVFDIILGTAKFPDVIAYATTEEHVVIANKKLGFDASGIVGNIIVQLARGFESKTRPDTDEKLSLDESPFWWTVNGETFYISGREFTQAIANILGQLQGRLLIDMDWDPEANYSEEDYDNFMQEALNVTANAFSHTLNNVVTKMQVTNFVPTLVGKIVNDPRFKNSFSPMKERKTSDELPLDELYKRAGGTPDVINKSFLGTYLRYTSSPTQFGQDFARLLSGFSSTESLVVTAQTVMKVSVNLNQLFVELDYPDAVSNAFNDILAKQAKSIMKEIVESPGGMEALDDDVVDGIVKIMS